MVIRKSRRRRRSSKRRKSPKKRVSRKRKSLKNPKKRVSKRRSNKKGGAQKDDPIAMSDAQLTPKEINEVGARRLSEVLKRDPDKFLELTGMVMNAKNTSTESGLVNEGFFSRLGRWVGVI